MTKELENKASEKMTKAVASLKAELNTLRAGRANPAMLDRITVDYYGTPTPLNQMAAVASPEPRLLTVQPWDQNALKDIEKALQAANLGINPSNDGKVIRLAIPQLTEERRKELCKKAEKEGESAKVAIRNIRRNTIEEMKTKEKAKEITEDDLKEGEKNLQKLTDDFAKEIDKVIEEKKKEITTI